MVLLPLYIQNILRPRTVGPGLRPTNNMVFVPRTRLIASYGDMAFSCMAPSLWNSLPEDLSGNTKYLSFSSDSKHLYLPLLIHLFQYFLFHVDLGMFYRVSAPYKCHIIFIITLLHVNEFCLQLESWNNFLEIWTKMPMHLSVSLSMFKNENPFSKRSHRFNVSDCLKCDNLKSKEEIIHYKFWHIGFQDFHS